MATITSVGSGLWSAAGTWDSGVPVDNDVVVIAAGHVVEFDVDQSGFANGIDGITITGTLKLTRTAGTYYLKIKATKTIAGAGTFDCGTAVSPIPFASKHTITGGAAWYIYGASGLTMTVFAAEPTVKLVHLTAGEPLGETVLEVDTDLTGDIWQAGDTVIVCEINSNTEMEIREIAVGGIAAGTITITAGLTAAKNTGAAVCMMTRNVVFIQSGTAHLIKEFVTGNLIIGGGQFDHQGTGNTFYKTAPYISGGTFTGGVIGGSCTGAIISGGLFCKSTNYTISGVTELLISGGYFAGSIGFVIGGIRLKVTGGYFTCSYYPLYTCYGTVVTGGTFRYVTRALDGCNKAIILGGIFDKSGSVIGTYSTAEIRNIVTSRMTAVINNSLFTAYNVFFDGTEFSGYTTFAKELFSESYDHNQVAGAYKCWGIGGITTKQAVTVPVGYSSAMQTVLESAINQGYWQKEITIGAGASVNIAMNLRKDAAMTYLPRIIVFNKASTDPFAGGAGLYTFTMTDSVDTWEDDLYTYTNSGSEDVTLVIRCQGMNATGNMYSALDIEQINVDLTNAIAKIDVIDGLVDAIKEKTDQLAFTVANQVDANALSGGTTPADVADAVWDEAIADHAVGTTFGGKNQKVVPSESVNDYKADVSNLALEATLTAIKGAGWTTETLKEIKDTIDALPAGISTADIMSTVVEGTFTLQDVLKIMAGALAGKLDGGGTGTLTFRDLSDTLDRIIATVDLSNGDRDDVTLDLT